MDFTLHFVDGRLFTLLKQSGHIRSFLESRRTILQVNVVVKHMLFTLEVHEGD
jgi:hypothetical protein